MSDTELKACPFCGHSAAPESVGVDHFVMCDGCCAESARFQSPGGDHESAKRRAIAAWNRRPLPDDVARDARVAALEQAAAICDEEGDEWDSDALITEKNYAHACRDRIRAAIAAAARGE